MNIVRFIPRHTMDDLRIYCQNEEDQLNVVSFLEENFPDVKICTWDPDPVDTGSWGMFVDEFEPDLWSKLVEHLESEDCWVYEDMIELYLETDDGIKEYTSDFLGSVAESVDAPDLKSVNLLVVGVQVPPLLS